MDGKGEKRVGDDGGRTHRTLEIHVWKSQEKDQEDSSAHEGCRYDRFVKDKV